jgi:hypothetical protein
MLIIESAIAQMPKIEYKSDKDDKVVFKAILQTADEINANKRMYPRSVLEKGLRECKRDMLKRGKMGELDHPIPTGNEAFDEIRQTTVLLSEASHLILDYEWRGNQVWGLMETLPTPKGRILSSLLRAKTEIGTSMRGFGDLEDRGNYKVVLDPLVIITYDMVQKPSHSEALVKEVTFENITRIQESASGLICKDGKCYLPDYFDMLVRKSIIRFEKRWI